MIKMSVKYNDWDNNPVEEDVYFHLSMKELTALELEAENGLHARLMDVLKSDDKREILATFEWLIKISYGEREPQNPKKFRKTPEAANEFMESQAYDAVLSQLLISTTACINFINGIMPAALMESEQVKAAIAEAESGPRTLKDVQVSEVVLSSFTDAQSGLKQPRDKDDKFFPWAFRTPTDAELRKMPRTQLLDAMSRQSKGWTPPEQVEISEPNPSQ